MYVILIITQIIIYYIITIKSYLIFLYKINYIKLNQINFKIICGNIYRIYFNTSPITNEQRKEGFGGTNRYKDLEGYNNSELVINKTPFKINMVEIPDETFFKTLRNKLLWGEDKRNQKKFPYVYTTILKNSFQNRNHCKTNNNQLFI